MKFFINLILIFSLLISCDRPKSQLKTKSKELEKVIKHDKKKTNQVIDKKSSSINLSFKNLLENINLKKTPLIDSTNFDNFKAKVFYNLKQIKALNLKKIYPKIDNETKFESTNKDGKPPYTYYLTKDDFKVTASYRLNLSNNFTTVVLVIYKGKNELESVLINYDLDGKIIDYKTVSYDEIAEGAFRIISKIETGKLLISAITSFEKVKEEKAEFKIEQLGKIVPITK